MSKDSMIQPTSSNISFVCEADRQKRALHLVIGVAGKPTTTTPIPLFRLSLENFLKFQIIKSKTFTHDHNHHLMHLYHK